MRAPHGECGFESRAFRLCPDGEMEITPRFYRGVPGSSPDRGAKKCGVRNAEFGIKASEGEHYTAFRTPDSAFEWPPMVKRKSRLGPNEAVRVRLPVGAYMVSVV